MSNPIYKGVGSPVVRLIEECAELQKALCKVQRFGWTNYNPVNGPDRTNLIEVKEEIDDVLEACDLLLVHIQELLDAGTLHSEF